VRPLGLTVQLLLGIAGESSNPKKSGEPLGTGR
jgi:hypothetical protein